MTRANFLVRIVHRGSRAYNGHMHARNRFTKEKKSFRFKRRHLGMRSSVENRQLLTRGHRGNNSKKRHLIRRVISPCESARSCARRRDNAGIDNGEKRWEFSPRFLLLRTWTVHAPRPQVLSDILQPLWFPAWGCRAIGTRDDEQWKARRRRRPKRDRSREPRYVSRASIKAFLTRSNEGFVKRINLNETVWEAESSWLRKL